MRYAEILEGLSKDQQEEIYNFANDIVKTAINYDIIIKNEDANISKKFYYGAVDRSLKLKAMLKNTHEYGQKYGPIDSIQITKALKHVVKKLEATIKKNNLLILKISKL